MSGKLPPIYKPRLVRSSLYFISAWGKFLLNAQRHYGAYYCKCVHYFTNPPPSPNMYIYTCIIYITIIKIDSDSVIFILNYVVLQVKFISAQKKLSVWPFFSCKRNDVPLLFCQSVFVTVTLCLTTALAYWKPQNFLFNLLSLWWVIK